MTEPDVRGLCTHRWEFRPGSSDAETRRYLCVYCGQWGERPMTNPPWAWGKVRWGKLVQVDHSHDPEPWSEAGREVQPSDWLGLWSGRTPMR